MEAIKNIKYIKNNWSGYKDWELQQKNEDAGVELLKKTNPPSASELKKSQNYGLTLINAVNIMDQISINKSENALVSINSAFSMISPLIAGIGTLTGYLISELSHNKNKTPKIAAFVGYSIASLLDMVVLTFLNAHYEKLTTRIARFQTRNNELKDIKNFIIYSDEQIEQAKENVKSFPDVKDVTQDMTFKESLNPIKVFKKSFATLKELKKDFKSYQTWHEKYIEENKNKDTKFQNMNVEAKELVESQKDRDKILKAIKKLEISSNDYEINTHLFVKIASVVGSLCTIAGGLTLSWGLNKLSLKTANAKMTEFLNYMSKMSVPAGILGMVLLTGPLVKLLKDSARIGRFKEKEKLSGNSSSFIAYSDLEKEKVKNIINVNPEKTSVMGVVKKDFNNIFNMKKDFKDYEKYKNTKLKEELKLRKSLKDIPVSQEQIEDAQRLQQQVFKAFETVDDKSESFVDDTNALVSSVTSLITGTTCTLANLLTLKLFGNKIRKFTNYRRMPGFIEGLELTKFLSLKDLSLIFIAPFLATRLLITGFSILGAEINKKACRIGVMTAMKDLENPKNFIFEKKQLKSQINSADKKNIFKDFMKV